MSQNSVVKQIEERGFARVPLGLPSSVLERLTARICSRLGIDATDSSTWTLVPEESRGFVPLWNDLALWEIRLWPALKAVFVDLLADQNIWVSVDRCHFKPPVNVHPDLGRQHFIHWDSDPEDPLFHQYQGVISLTDNPYDQGAFTCSPEVFEFVRRGDLTEADRLLKSGIFETVQVACEAGDLIVWDHRMLHGNSANTGSAPRFAMYVSMFPAGSENQAADRTRAWKSGHWPHGPSKYPGFDIADSPAVDLSAIAGDLLGFEPLR